jgi:hypothetical protein
MKRIFILLLVISTSCQFAEADLQTQQVVGYVPVYASQETITALAPGPAQPTIHPGKIYAYGAYLFQVEQFKGIHIIDNSDPQQAHKIAFLNVPSATEIAIKSDHLYTNNGNDLVVFNLANVMSPQLVHRIENAFPPIDQDYPPFSNTVFECPDPAKGIVVAWEQKTLTNPKCRR